MKYDFLYDIIIITNKNTVHHRWYRYPRVITDGYV